MPEGGRLDGGQSVCLPSERRQTRLGVARYIPAASSLTDSCGPLRRSVSLSPEHQHSGDDEEEDIGRNRPDANPVLGMKAPFDAHRRRDVAPKVTRCFIR